MKRSLLALAALAFVASGCGGDSDAIDEACSLVARAEQVAQRELAGSPEEAQFSTVTAALNDAHEAVMRLSSRDARRLARSCDAVSGVESGRFRSTEFAAFAVDLRAVEDRLSREVQALATARQEFANDVRFACNAIRRADEPRVAGAIDRLGNVDRALELLDDTWDEEQRAAFFAECDVELDEAWEETREALVTAAAAEQAEIDERAAQRAREEAERAAQRAREEAEAAQRETEEMLAILVQMERAWNSISRSDRATVCSMFRQDRIGTSQQWVRLSGYGKPEYAFVFLSQACG